MRNYNDDHHYNDSDSNNDYHYFNDNHYCNSLHLEMINMTQVHVSLGPRVYQIYHFGALTPSAGPMEPNWAIRPTSRAICATPLADNGRGTGTPLFWKRSQT